LETITGYNHSKKQ